MVDRSALLLSALTILTSGVVSAMVTYRLNVRREGRDLRRQKLEALYMHTTAYCTSLSSHYIPYLSAMHGRLDLNQVYDLTNARGRNDDRSFDNLRMLIELYVPSAQPILDDLLACREALSKTTAQFTNAYKIGRTDGAAYVQPLKDALDRLDGIEETLKAVVRREARVLVGRTWVKHRVQEVDMKARVR
jgi:hypothetical protein